MGEMLLAGFVVWIFGGSSKPAKKTEDNGASKLPTAAMPNWRGQAGVHTWVVTRSGTRWWWSVKGIGSAFANDPLAAIRRAFAAAIAVDAVADQFSAIPVPGPGQPAYQLIEGRAWYGDGAWRWEASETGNASADAEGEKDTREEAIEEMLSWLTATAEGRPRG